MTQWPLDPAGSLLSMRWLFFTLTFSALSLDWSSVHLLVFISYKKHVWWGSLGRRTSAEVLKTAAPRMPTQGKLHKPNNPPVYFHLKMPNSSGLCGSVNADKGGCGHWLSTRRPLPPVWVTELDLRCLWKKIIRPAVYLIVLIACWKKICAPISRVKF